VVDPSKVERVAGVDEVPVWDPIGVLAVADVRVVGGGTVPLLSTDWDADVSNAPFVPVVAVDSVLTPVVPTIVQ
jgi:hypothetical protein